MDQWVKFGFVTVLLMLAFSVAVMRKLAKVVRYRRISREFEARDCMLNLRI